MCCFLSETNIHSSNIKYYPFWFSWKEIYTLYRKQPGHGGRQYLRQSSHSVGGTRTRVYDHCHSPSPFSDCGGYNRAHLGPITVDSYET